MTATADLFEAPLVPTGIPTGVPTPPVTLRPAGGPTGVVPPTPQLLVAPRTRHLWYAVVFPRLDADPQAASMLQRLCLTAQRFTSRVSVELPNALLLEIHGSVKLFDSLDALHAKLDAAWAGLGLDAHSAAAPTTLAALWCARAGKPMRITDVRRLAGHLAELPTTCTAWDADWLQTLRSLGVTRLGDLQRLPRAGVARRLSPAAVLDLDIAYGRQAAPRRAFVVRERFRARYDFEAEIETVLYLQKALEPLVERCAQFLRERQAGVQALELRLRHRMLPTTRVRLGLANITGERRRLADVLEQRLHRLALTAPVRGMELLSGALRPLSADSLDAFAGAPGAGRYAARDTVPQLVERLRARLGEEAVYGVCSVPEHRPEAAWERVRELPLTGVKIHHDNAGRAAPAHHDMPRPVWLLAAPVQLSADLVLEQGPERIESGWWDGKGVARDYYVARAACGARWWVFQERQTKDWYLHGVFA